MLRGKGGKGAKIKSIVYINNNKKLQTLTRVGYVAGIPDLAPRFRNSLG